MMHKATRAAALQHRVLGTRLRLIGVAALVALLGPAGDTFPASRARKIKLEIQVINQNPSAGKLKPKKSFKVPYGASRTIKAKPKRGNLAVIRLDGQDVAQGQRNKRVRYKLKKVVASHTIEALFVPQYTPPSRPETPPSTPELGIGLNDTGVTRCGNASSNDAACRDAAATTDQYPRQDAEYGRDVTANDPADGRAGFSFVKLDGAGAPLASQSATYAVAPWSCVRDRVTHLTWEVKTDDGGPRDRDWRYSWHDSAGIAGGRGRGRPNAGTCADLGACDTEKYVAAVNSAGLCGFSDWRLPTRSELLSLVDYGAPAAPLIDAGFFPDGVADAYWTSSRDGLRGPWTVDFADGSSRSQVRFDARPVRLVRGGS